MIFFSELHDIFGSKTFSTRKYPLRGYFLGVLTHTTAWDQFWGGDFFLRLYIHSSASPRLTKVWLGFWNSDHVVLKLSIHSLASPRSVGVWLAFWNSGHVVLRSTKRSLASPRRQWSYWGLRVTKDAYFSFLKHAKQLLLVTFCETTAGNRKKWKCDRRTDGCIEGQTDLKSEMII